MPTSVSNTVTLNREEYVLQFSDALGTTPELENVQLEDAMLAHLFAGDEQELSRFRLLSFRNEGAHKERADQYDFANQLRTDLNLESCEPASLHTYFYDATPEVDACRSNAAAPAEYLWAVKNTNASRIWTMPSAKGRGVTIAQPGHNWLCHAELEGTALRDDDPAGSPVKTETGHSRATSLASVVVSRQMGHISGSAPAAQILPLDCPISDQMISVPQLVRSLEQAINNDCQIISLPFGCGYSAALQAIIQYAISKDVLVIAPSGDCGLPVTYPARFEHVLAVSGSAYDDKIWTCSARGPQVDFAAPAEMVWCAAPQLGHKEIFADQGTSYASSISCGIAAVWLSHHGPRVLKDVARVHGTDLQALFRTAVKHTARRHNEWNRDLDGEGVIDARALLRLQPGDIPFSGQDEQEAKSSAGRSNLALLTSEVLGLTSDAHTTPLYSHASELSERYYSSILAARIGAGETAEEPRMSVGLKSILEEMPRASTG